MTIQEANTVDGFGIHKDSETTWLLISDHLTWQDEKSHFLALESKLESYLEFIKSGQLIKQLPDAVGLPVKIILVHEHEPSVSAREILDSVTQQLSEMHIGFTIKSLP